MNSSVFNMAAATGASSNTTATNNTSEMPVNPNAEFEYYVRIIVPPIYGIISLLGLFGNTLVIIVVLFNKNMRNTTNLLILSLAVADLLFILICVPSTAIKYALPRWPFGEIWCKLQAYLVYVCCLASMYTLVLMSLDRYLAVVHAIRSMQWRTERNTTIAIAIAWVIILCANINQLLTNTVFEYPDHYNPGQWKSSCIDTFTTQMDDDVDVTDNQRILYGSFFIFGYLVPLSFTMILYGLMLKRLLYGVAPGGRNQSAESIRTKKKVTRMVIIVVVIFATCWMPIQIIFMVTAFGTYPQTVSSTVIMMAAQCFAYMNSCVNPILYAFLSDNFRRSFRKVLCCSDTTRRGDYDRSNVRFTACETETKNTSLSNNKALAAV